MKTIYKYKLIPEPCTHRVRTITAPRGAKALHVGSQGEDLFVWLEVETTQELEDHVFEVFGTGQEMYEDMGVSREFIGSIQMQVLPLVFHVYERKF